MRIANAAVVAGLFWLAGCATGGSADGARPESSSTYGLYRDPHGYCRLARRGSTFELGLKKDFWRSMGFYESADAACKRMAARGCATDDKSCEEPPTD